MSASAICRNCLLLVFAVCVGYAAGQITTEEIRVISDQIWQADTNRASDEDVQYNTTHTPCSPLFTYVNEEVFSGPTYAAFLALAGNYDPVIGNPELCGQECRDEEDAFLDAILSTRPIILLHNWLFGKGLAPQAPEDFKANLRQYLFMPYSRSSGQFLDSSGFEHCFLGELRANRVDVTGFHNWITAYFREKAGVWLHASHLGTCPNEVIAFNFLYYGAYKPISSMFVRTSPELEVALYSLCLNVHNGTGCPVRRDGVNLTMTSWDMTGLPKTIGSAYPNCP